MSGQKGLILLEVKVPDEKGVVVAAEASSQEPPAAEETPQAVVPAETAEASAEAKAAEPDYQALYAQSEKKSAELEKELNNVRSDKGQAKKLAKQLQEVTGNLRRLEGNYAEDRARRSKEADGEDAMERAAAEARQPFEAEETNASMAQIGEHGAEIVQALVDAGLNPEKDWYTNDDLVGARAIWARGYSARDPSITEGLAHIVTRLLAGRSNGSKGQAQPGNGAAKATPVAAAPVPAQPKRPGVNMDAGPGAGAAADSAQALVNRLARQELLTDDEFAKAKTAMDNGVYPTLKR